MAENPNENLPLLSPSKATTSSSNPKTIKPFGTILKGSSKVLSVIWKPQEIVIREINKIGNEAKGVTNLRAIVAIYSNVLLWVGAWNVLTIAYAPTYARSIIYLSVGLICMLYVGTLYQNAGYGGSFRNPEFYQTWFKLKVAISLFGQFVYYIGLDDVLYTIIINTKNSSNVNKYYIIKDCILFVVGFFILSVLTDTYWSVAGVRPPWYNVKSIEPNASLLQHFKFIILSIIALFGYMSIWVSVKNFEEIYTAQTIWRELFYIAVGLLVFVATGSFVSNSHIWTDNDEDESILIDNWEWYHFGIFYIRAFFAFIAQITHNVGAWIILDSYIYHPNIYRDLLYILLGLLGLTWSNAVLLNVSITPYNVPLHPDGLAKIYNNNSQQEISQNTENNNNNNNKLSQPQEEI